MKKILRSERSRSRSLNALTAVMGGAALAVGFVLPALGESDARLSQNGSDLERAVPAAGEPPRPASQPLVFHVPRNGQDYSVRVTPQISIKVLPDGSRVEEATLSQDELQAQLSQLPPRDQ